MKKKCIIIFLILLFNFFLVVGLVWFSHEKSNRKITATSIDYKNLETDSNGEKVSVFTEDYALLLEILQDYYPDYKGFTEENDFLTLYESKKEIIRNIYDPYEFCQEVVEVLSLAGNEGHLSTLSKGLYDKYVEAVASNAISCTQDEIDALNSEAAKNFYGGLFAFDDSANQEIIVGNAAGDTPSLFLLPKSGIIIRMAID